MPLPTHLHEGVMLPGVEVPVQVGLAEGQLLVPRQLLQLLQLLHDLRSLQVLQLLQLLLLLLLLLNRQRSKGQGGRVEIFKYTLYLDCYIY